MGDAEEGGRDGAEGRGERRGLGEEGGCRSALPFLYCCYSVIKTVLVCFSAVQQCQFRGSG